MATVQERAEIMKFSITVWAIETAPACCDTEEIAAEVIALTASYGPSKNEQTEELS